MEEKRSLTPAEEWCVDSVQRLALPLDDIAECIRMSYGDKVRHEAVIEEVKKRRGVR